MLSYFYSERQPGANALIRNTEKGLYGLIEEGEQFIEKVFSPNDVAAPINCEGEWTRIRQGNFMQLYRGQKLVDEWWGSYLSNTSSIAGGFCTAGNRAWVRSTETVNKIYFKNQVKSENESAGGNCNGEHWFHGVGTGWIRVYYQGVMCDEVVYQGAFSGARLPLGPFSFLRTAESVDAPEQTTLIFCEGKRIFEGTYYAAYNHGDYLLYQPTVDKLLVFKGKNTIYEGPYYKHYINGDYCVFWPTDGTAVVIYKNEKKWEGVLPLNYALAISGGYFYLYGSGEIIVFWEGEFVKKITYQTYSFNSPGNYTNSRISSAMIRVSSFNENSRTHYRAIHLWKNQIVWEGVTTSSSTGTAGGKYTAVQEYRNNTAYWKIDYDGKTIEGEEIRGTSISFWADGEYCIVQGSFLIEDEENEYVTETRLYYRGEYTDAPPSISTSCNLVHGETALIYPGRLYHKGILKSSGLTWATGSSYFGIYENCIFGTNNSAAGSCFFIVNGEITWSGNLRSATIRSSGHLLFCQSGVGFAAFFGSEKVTEKSWYSSFDARETGYMVVSGSSNTDRVLLHQNHLLAQSWYSITSHNVSHVLVTHDSGSPEAKTLFAGSEEALSGSFYSASLTTATEGKFALLTTKETASSPTVQRLYFEEKLLDTRIDEGCTLAICGEQCRFGKTEVTVRGYDAEADEKLEYRIVDGELRRLNWPNSSSAFYVTVFDRSNNDTWLYFGSKFVSHQIGSPAGFNATVSSIYLPPGMFAIQRTYPEVGGTTKFPTGELFFEGESFYQGNMEWCTINYSSDRNVSDLYTCIYTDKETWVAGNSLFSPKLLQRVEIG